MLGSYADSHRIKSYLILNSSLLGIVHMLHIVVIVIINTSVLFLKETYYLLQILYMLNLWDTYLKVSLCYHVTVDLCM